MLRSFFLALGLYACILGAECLILDKAVLAPSKDTLMTGVAQKAGYREITPAEWAPWSLLSVGAVVLLYSFTLPAKMRG